MAESSLTHPTYTFVDKAEADAIAWAFVDKDTMKQLPFKFPELKPNEIRAKITYTGLCRSDSHTVRGEWGGCEYPIAPGHEIVGEVTHLGSDVTDFKIGDKVGFGTLRNNCGTCDSCKDGLEQLCEGPVDQLGTYGKLFWGGYATSLQNRAKFFYKIPENLPIERVPPLFCAGITTYAPIARYAKPGQEVAVLGIGGLGHMAVMYAKAWGCKVTAFTSSLEKEKFIKDLGADRVVINNEANRKAEGAKFHLVINTLPVGDELNSLLMLTKRRGVFCQLGAPEFDKPSPLNPMILMMHELNFVGSAVGSIAETKNCLEFSSKHNIVPLCEQFGFDDFPKAYDKLVNGKPVFRCVVDCTKPHTH